MFGFFKIGLRSTHPPISRHRYNKYLVFLELWCILKVNYSSQTTPRKFWYFKNINGFLHLLISKGLFYLGAFLWIPVKYIINQQASVHNNLIFDFFWYIISIEYWVKLFFFSGQEKNHLTWYEISGK